MSVKPEYSNTMPLNADYIRHSVQQHARENKSDGVLGKISFFETIDSTNAWLIEHGECGDICLSEMQTAGRGRSDNKWVSPQSGNIYLSYCCCFDSSIKHRSLLGLVVGIAIAEALEDIGLKGHGIKWPNDIFWQWKKLGGILIQTSNSSDKFVIGIGLNINLPHDSLSEITQAAVGLDDAMCGKTFLRDEVVIQLIKRLSDHIGAFAGLPFRQFEQAWQRWDILNGESVSFEHRGHTVSGVVDKIDQYGRLGILLENNTLEFFSSADIKLKKKPF